MSEGASQLGKALASRGFVQIERPRGFKKADLRSDLDLWYFGQVNASRGSANIYVHVPDMSLVKPPAVYLVERPPWIQGWRPHLLGTDEYEVENLCYNDFEQYQLLAHDIGGAILRVLEDATETLDRISDPATVVQDGQREFARLWPSDFSSTYIDCIPESGTVVECRTALWDGAQRNTTLLVGEDPSRVGRRLGIAPDELRSSARAMVFGQEGAGLYMMDVGPPRNLREVKSWLEQVGPATHALWHRALQQRTFYQRGVKYCFFVTQGQVIGFLVEYPSNYLRVKSAKQTREAFAESMYERPLPVHRLHAWRVDDDYLIGRNLPPGDRDLRGAKILLIGAGAVGGFLACGLLKLGAGLDSPAGATGCITIWDGETLTPANIGRHVLGTTSIGKPKATEVRQHLQQLSPGCNVIQVPEALVPKAEELQDFDVIIDATGHETYARFLSRLCRSSRWLDGSGKALLHVWIEGRGAVVRGLIQRKPQDACYDCLWNHSVSTEPRPRFPAYSDESWTRHSADGYATMTPFAVTAPMDAAALGLDLLRARADPKAPSFVSRVVDAPGVQPGISKSPNRISTCPSCHLSS